MEIIHIVLGRANPHRMNGVNRVVHNLATAQTAEGADVAVWGITASADLPDELERTYTTRWFQPAAWKFVVGQELQTAIKNHAHAVFHLHGGFIPVFYHLSRLLKKAGVRFFLTPHGTYTEGAMQGNGVVKKIYFALLEKGLLSRVTGVQCLGHCEVTDLKKLYDKVAITTIPNGQNWEELIVNKDFSPDKQFIIGYCGRVSRWQKGMDILLAAFIRYKKEYQGKGCLHLVGDGEYRDEMEKAAIAAGLSDQIIFHGKQFGEEKVILLKNMKVFVHTSRNEGLPTAVIEAAALGIPSIVSEMTSMDRYITDHNAGWALQSLETDAVAQVFVQAEAAFHSGELVDKGKNALKMALESFDWNVISRQTFALYAG